MKTRIFTISVLTVMMLLTACSEQFRLQDLFSGTLPRIEIRDGESLKYTEARSLFIRIMDDELEYNGSIYDLELLEDTEDEYIFGVAFSLDDDISVNGISYLKNEQALLLNLEPMGKELLLDQFDNMIGRKAGAFAMVELSGDISHLSEDQKELIGILFQVADLMEDIYWQQVFPDREAALGSMMDENMRKFFRINYGPWERLNGNLPYLPDYGPKPAGSGFYPADMTKEEFEALDHPDKSSLYTLIQRGEGGALEVLPYHIVYAEQIQEAAGLLKDAAELAEDQGFKKYLELRAEALLTDDYLASDLAWMDMKNNEIDFVVGPIENYEDALYNYKAAHESFILIKDMEWSKKLAYISSVLPEMQRNLPVPAEYKKKVPGSKSDLGAYEVIYYAGDCNAGSKTIAINLPNDSRVHAAKGSRKLQLKNAIRYKFEEILVPISNVLIDESQREYITFDAFFENIMFHEVAHGLGIDETVNGKGMVREALMDQYSALEEGKADILGLFLITQMAEKGMLDDNELMDNYVTFMAGLFRSIRFGVASSHGKANMIRFYYFQEAGAFSKHIDGTYKVDFEKMQRAMNDLATLILITQGDGNYNFAKELVEDKGFIREELQSDLDRLQELNIPVDIVFDQGPEKVGF